MSEGIFKLATVAKQPDDHGISNSQYSVSEAARRLQASGSDSGSSARESYRSLMNEVRVPPSLSAARKHGESLSDEIKRKGELQAAKENHEREIDRSLQTDQNSIGRDALVTARWGIVISGVGALAAIASVVVSLLVR